MNKTLAADEAEGAPTPEELAKEGEHHVTPVEVEVVQPDLFKEYIKSEGGDIVSFAPNTPFEVWESYTVGMLEFTRRSMRVVGQCLLGGERLYGERYAQVIDSMRYNLKTLQNAVLVVKNIKKWHDDLSFAHHDVVAALPGKAQSELLDIASEQKLAVGKLRSLRNEKYPSKKTGGKKPKKDNSPKLNVADEGEVLQSAHLVIAFLEKAEADLPFRKWEKARMKNWEPIFRALVKITRRGLPGRN